MRGPTEASQMVSEALRQAGMKQVELARRTGLTVKHINMIVRGKAPITPPVAVAFEMYLPVTAEALMQAEMNRLIFEARQSRREKVRPEVQGQMPLWEGYPALTDEPGKVTKLTGRNSVHNPGPWLGTRW